MTYTTKEMRPAIKGATIIDIKVCPGKLRGLSLEQALDALPDRGAVTVAWYDTCEIRHTTTCPNPEQARQYLRDLIEARDNSGEDC